MNNKPSEHPELKSIEQRDSKLIDKLAKAKRFQNRRSDREIIPECERTRTLGWTTQQGEMIPVWDMTDEHLRWAIDLTRQRINTGKLITGCLSLSQLTLDYLEAEAIDRNLSTE